MAVNLRVNLAPSHPRGLWLQNPVMTASGTFGYGTEYRPREDLARLGAIICKGTTLHPRAGNPPPRVAETPAGMLNAIGLQNLGVDEVVRTKAPVWATLPIPVLVNIAGESIEEYVEVARRLEGVAGIAGIELNISCPNTARGGMLFGCDPAMAAEVTRAVVAVTSLPVMVKLTPNVADVRPVAEAVVQAGAHAVSLINTLPGMAIDLRARTPYLAAGSGGLSGPAIKPVALRMVYQVAQVVDVPVVGVGGIMNADDALEFIVAGATAVQVGTATFANPRAPFEIADGIRAYLEAHGIRDIAELRGAALPQAARRSPHTKDAGILHATGDVAAG
jgi:dihydroorotate dehydrogenase (NAD+) catalytic subunit